MLYLRQVKVVACGLERGQEGSRLDWRSGLVRVWFRERRKGKEFFFFLSWWTVAFSNSKETSFHDQNCVEWVTLDVRNPGKSIISAFHSVKSGKTKEKGNVNAFWVYNSHGTTHFSFLKKIIEEILGGKIHSWFLSTLKPLLTLPPFLPLWNIYRLTRMNTGPYLFPLYKD